MWEISNLKINNIRNSSITIRLKHYILVGEQTTLYIIVCLKTFGRREENFYAISILLIYKTTKNILNFQNDRGIFHKNICIQLLFGYAINEALDNLNKDTFPLPFVPNDRVAFKS